MWTLCCGTQQRAKPLASREGNYFMLSELAAASLDLSQGFGSNRACDLQAGWAGVCSEHRNLEIRVPEWRLCITCPIPSSPPPGILQGHCCILLQEAMHSNERLAVPVKGSRGSSLLRTDALGTQQGPEDPRGARQPHSALGTGSNEKLRFFSAYFLRNRSLRSFFCFQSGNNETVILF